MNNFNQVAVQNYVTSFDGNSSNTTAPSAASQQPSQNQKKHIPLLNQQVRDSYSLTTYQSSGNLLARPVQQSPIADNNLSITSHIHSNYIGSSQFNSSTPTQQQQQHSYTGTEGLKNYTAAAAAVAAATQNSIQNQFFVQPVNNNQAVPSYYCNRDSSPVIHREQNYSNHLNASSTNFNGYQMNNQTSQGFYDNSSKQQSFNPKQRGSPQRQAVATTIDLNQFNSRTSLATAVANSSKNNSMNYIPEYLQSHTSLSSKSPQTSRTLIKNVETNKQQQYSLQQSALNQLHTNRTNNNNNNNNSSSKQDLSPQLRIQTSNQMAHRLSPYLNQSQSSNTHTLKKESNSQRIASSQLSISEQSTKLQIKCKTEHQQQGDIMYSKQPPQSHGEQQKVIAQMKVKTLPLTGVADSTMQQQLNYQSPSNPSDGIIVAAASASSEKNQVGVLERILKPLYGFKVSQNRKTSPNEKPRTVQQQLNYEPSKSSATTPENSVSHDSKKIYEINNNSSGLIKELNVQKSPLSSKSAANSRNLSPLSTSINLYPNGNSTNTTMITSQPQSPSLTRNRVFPQSNLQAQQQQQQQQKSQYLQQMAQNQQSSQSSQQQQHLFTKKLLEVRSGQASASSVTVANSGLSQSSYHVISDTAIMQSSKRVQKEELNQSSNYSPIKQRDSSGRDLSKVINKLTTNKIQTAKNSSTSPTLLSPKGAQKQQFYPTTLTQQHSNHLNLSASSKNFTIQQKTTGMERLFPYQNNGEFSSNNNNTSLSTPKQQQTQLTSNSSSIYSSAKQALAKQTSQISTSEFDPQLAYTPDNNTANSGRTEINNPMMYAQKTDKGVGVPSQPFLSQWCQKRNSNNEFVMQAKINNFNQCVALLDKRMGEARAEVDFKDEQQNTALHYAAINGNITLLNFLLYNYAMLDPQNIHQQTPFILACKEGHDDICSKLMNSGADINAFDSEQNTGLHYAASNGHYGIVNILLFRPSLFFGRKNAKGFDARSLAKDPKTAECFERFFSISSKVGRTQVKLPIYSTEQQEVLNMFKQVSQPSAVPPFQVSNINLNVNTQNNQQTQQVDATTNGCVVVTASTASAATPVNRNEKGSENGAKSLSMDDKSSTSDESKNSFETKPSTFAAKSSSNEKAVEKVGPSHFQVHGLIGKGSFGEVYLVEKKQSSILYAMKVLHKSRIQRNNLTKYAMTERNVMSITNHPFVVRLHYAFQTPDKLFLIMDYCPGGDLGELLQKEKKLNEDLVKIYLAETILALEDLHKRDVIFRDLKPDNIVLDYEGHVKLTDFGLSKEGVLDHSTGARSFCGSVAYLAPEMLKRCGHGKAVDWYLLGVVMYELLVGIPPYYANNRDELFANIEKAPLKIPSTLSNEAKSLLKALLQRNPAKRLGSGKGDSEEIKVHPFFGNIDWEQCHSRNLRPPKPNRKIRISTKIDPNLFAEDELKGFDHIAGWSFATQ